MNSFPPDRLADLLRGASGTLEERYEILEELGRGGVSAVFRARDRKLGREVAVKVLQAHLETAPDARRRFEREWQAHARLHHPNLVTVHDAGEDGGRMYLVMELVRGRPLHEILRRHKYDPRGMAALLEKAARGVQIAHEAGIVHRDLKPSNLLVTEAGEPKVADFGLAHLLSHQSAAITGSSIVGTPVYMSPEQATFGAITPATDVYALGAILYEIVTGRPPHSGASVSEILANVVHEDPPAPWLANPSAPRELGIIAMKALEKEPARRYPSAAEFADDLRRFLEHRPIVARPPGPVTRLFKWSRRHRTASAVVVLLAAGAAVLVGLRAASDAEIRSLLELAARAEREGRYGQAAEIYSDVRSRRPGHAVAERKAVEMREAAESAARRGKAAAYVDAGRRAARERALLEGEIARIRARIGEMGEGIRSFDGPERKRPLWDLERQLGAKERELAVRTSDMVAAYTAALGHDPANRDARRALAELHFSDYERAEREGDAVRMAVAERLVRHFDDGTFAPRLDPSGTVVVETSPPGGTMELLRFEEGDGGTLETRSLGKFENGPAAAGSYLLILRREGYRDVRLPLRVRRGETHRAVVRLYTEREIGPEFVYVPGGRFESGGDALVYQAAERAYPDLPDFFIGRYEITFSQYRAFVEDVARTDPARAAIHLPRDPGGPGLLWRLEGGRVAYVQAEMRDDWPVFGLSWEDASEYCRWRTAKAREAGDDAVYRLPTNLEWEKAARGVDGRPFPWGWRFDWTFLKGEPSRPGASVIEPIGAFPKDESPYGVCDLAGSMREWCADWYDGITVYKHVRGGAWCYTHKIPAAGRSWREPTWVGVEMGFRVVRDLQQN